MKKTIRLNENELNCLIKETLSKLLKEKKHYLHKIMSLNKIEILYCKY